ncbi:MAG TPA: sigma-70 family RNA polymerase sigma factor [Planctomycetes bacterium]|nr:sigma-70 family RNA polymerase sigma factor [Planctomycetota bacterium]
MPGTPRGSPRTPRTRRGPSPGFLRRPLRVRALPRGSGAADRRPAGVPALPRAATARGLGGRRLGRRGSQDPKAPGVHRVPASPFGRLRPPFGTDRGRQLESATLVGVSDRPPHSPTSPLRGEELVHVLYAELRSLAASFLGRRGHERTMQATALVHEAWLRLSDQHVPFESREHFLALAATVMRRVVVDDARRRGAQRRGGDWNRVTIDTSIGDGRGGAGIDAIALDEALEMLAKVDPRQARIVELRFFAGMTEDEVATVLDISRRTVSREWRMGRAFLAELLEEPQE